MPSNVPAGPEKRRQATAELICWTYTGMATFVHNLVLKICKVSKRPAHLMLPEVWEPHLVLSPGSTMVLTWREAASLCAHHMTTREAPMNCHLLKFMGYLGTAPPWCSSQCGTAPAASAPPRECCRTSAGQAGCGCLAAPWTGSPAGAEKGCG